MSYEKYFHYLILFWVCVGIVYCFYALCRLLRTSKKELSEAFEKRKITVSRKGNLFVFILLILFFVLSLMALSRQRNLLQSGIDIYVYYFVLEILSFLLFFQYRKTKINNKLKVGNILVKALYLWPIFFVNAEVLFFIPLFSGMHLLIFFLTVAKND